MKNKKDKTVKEELFKFYPTFEDAAADVGYATKIVETENGTAPRSLTTQFLLSVFDKELDVTVHDEYVTMSFRLKSFKRRSLLGDYVEKCYIKVN